MTARFALSARRTTGESSVQRFLEEGRNRFHTTTEIVPLEEVDGWSAEPDADVIAHRSGAFFGIIGIHVTEPGREWDQPIIDQPEVGVLGVAVRVHDGAMQCLLQAKAEPGTIGGVQLGPTVQATKSNYTRRHGGREVPYLSHFLGDSPAVQAFDVAQSEQGARFLAKHNRNIVTFVDHDLEVEDGFAWFSIGDVHRALRSGDFVNFDARTVLAGLGALDSAQHSVVGGHDDLSGAIAHSLTGSASAASTLDDLVSWLREARGHRQSVERRPLTALDSWSRRDGRLEHSGGIFFRVVGARVTASGREVGEWCQPLIVEENTALLGLAVAIVDDTVHVLLRATREPGLAKGVELGPTVQIVPETYRAVPGLPRPAAADLFEPGSGVTLFDQILSGEGGRFHEARQRHLIVLVEAIPEPPGHRWVSLHQFAEFVRRGLIVNEQARGLFACLLTLLTPPAEGGR